MAPATTSQASPAWRVSRRPPAPIVTQAAGSEAIVTQAAGSEAVEQCEVRGGGGAGVVVALRVRGYGRFGAYRSRRPARCSLDAAEVEFSYDDDTGLCPPNSSRS